MSPSVPVRSARPAWINASVRSNACNGSAIASSSRLSIVMLNHRLEMGGFGFAPAARALYFRLTVPVFPSDGVNPTILAPLGQGVVRNGLEFLPAFNDVIAGSSGDQIVERYEASLLTREPSGPDA